MSVKPLLKLVEERGPWPFITRRIFHLTDGLATDGLEYVWSSRHHRKNLREFPAVKITETLFAIFIRCVWSPQQMNWWIGLIFAIGAMLFAIGSVLCLTPSLAKTWSLDEIKINAIFFAGSIPFTTAAYLQLFQAANAVAFGENHSNPKQRMRLFGWEPNNAGWLSSALQFIGTILFNFNTFDAMFDSKLIDYVSFSDSSWLVQDFTIWIPNFIGSVLFLASGYLAFIETCHAHWAWRPRSISWWVVFINLLGCVGFMISAVLSVYLPGTPNEEVLTLATLFTLQGAICFFIGALLMLPEMVVHAESHTGAI